MYVDFRNGIIEWLRRKEGNRGRYAFQCGFTDIPEMVGSDIPCIETFEGGTASADYFPDEEELDGLLTQYQEYLTQECGEPEYSGTWTKDDVTIIVMSNEVLNQDHDFSKEGARTVLVSVYRSE